MSNKGLTIEIMRGQYDCTNHGITAREFNRTGLTLVGTVKRTYVGGGKPDVVHIVPLAKDARVFEASEERPAVAIDTNLPGTAYLRPVVPSIDGMAWVPAKGWHMAGGSYAQTSDSRWGEAVASFLGVDRFYGALAVHDRVE